jgi:hypothetical protein
MPATVAVTLEVDVEKGMATIRGLGDEFGKLPAAFGKTGQAGNRVFTAMQRQAQQARDATQFLSRSVGVELPRSVERVISQSKVLGPLLAKAFSAAIAFQFAQAVYTAVEPAIVAVINHINAFEDAVARIEERNQQRANKLILESSERIRQLTLRAALAGADEIHRIEIQLARDLDELHAREKEAGDAASIAAARKLIEERKALEAAAAAEIAAIRDRRAQEAAKRALAEEVERLNLWMAEEEKAVEEIKRRRIEAENEVRSIQQENIGIALSMLEGEQRVNEELEAKLERLREIKEQYKDNARVVAAANAQEILLTEQAQREVAEIRRRQAEEMQREWEAAVDQMAGALSAFLDDPARFLLNRWKQLLAQMLAEWLLTMGAMNSGLGRILGAIFGVGGGAGGGGGGFGNIVGAFLGGGARAGGGFSLRNLFGFSAGPSGAGVVSSTAALDAAIASEAGLTGGAGGTAAAAASQALATIATGVVLGGISIGLAVFGAARARAEAAAIARGIGAQMQTGYESFLSGSNRDFASFAAQQEQAWRQIPPTGAYGVPLEVRQQLWAQRAANWMAAARLEFERRQRARLLEGAVRPVDATEAARVTGGGIIIQSGAIVVNAAPGQNPQEIARAVVVEMRREAVRQGRT